EHHNNADNCKHSLFPGIASGTQSLSAHPKRRSKQKNRVEANSAPAALTCHRRKSTIPSHTRRQHRIAISSHLLTLQLHACCHFWLENSARDRHSTNPGRTYLETVEGVKSETNQLVEMVKLTVIFAWVSTGSAPSKCGLKCHCFTASRAAPARIGGPLTTCNPCICPSRP